MRIWRRFFYLILFIFPFGQFFRLSLTSFVPGLRLHLFEISIFIFVTFWFFRKIKLKEKFVLPKLFKEIALFGLLAAFSLFLKINRLKADEFLGALFYLIRFFNLMFFYWSLVDFFKKEHLPINKYLVWEGLAIAVFSLIFYLVLPDTKFLFNFGWDKHYYRAIGPFLDPAFTGLILCLSLITLVIDSLNKEKSLSFFLKGGLLLVAIGLTFSRLTYLSLFFGLSYVLFLKKNLRIYTLVFFFLLLIVILAPKPGGEGVDLLRKSSFFARFQNYQQSFQIIKNNFFFGVGFNAYRYAQRGYGFISQRDWRETNAGAGVDNSFLFVLATTGIIGLIVWIWWWLKIIIFCLKLPRKESLLFFSSLVIILVSSLFINSLFYPWVVFWLYLLLAKFTAENEEPNQALSYFEQGRNRRS